MPEQFRTVIPLLAISLSLVQISVAYHIRKTNLPVALSLWILSTYVQAVYDFNYFSVKEQMTLFDGGWIQ